MPPVPEVVAEYKRLKDVAKETRRTARTEGKAASGSSSLSSAASSSSSSVVDEEEDEEEGTGDLAHSDFSSSPVLSDLEVADLIADVLSFQGDLTSDLEDADFRSLIEEIQRDEHP